MKEPLEQMVIRHEDIRLKPYRDTVGKLTIGVGRNLDDMGITFQEAMTMFYHDIERIEKELDLAIPWWRGLSPARRAVFTDMCFMGISRFLTFKKMLAAAERGDYETAANEMLDSLWAKQVRQRAIELANLMRGAEEV